KRKFHTLTINWPGWREVGQLADLEIMPGLEAWKEAALGKAIMTQDGLDAFKRALNSDLVQVIVSPEDLDHLVEQSQSPFDPGRYLSPLLDAKRKVPQRRSQQDEGDRPTNEVETAIAEMWSSVFGIEHIVIHDSFLQVGGHSLLAMQIVSKIRSSYRIDFTLREFFEAPTVAQMSAVVATRIGSVTGTSTEDQALSVLSPMGQRYFSAARVQTPLFFGPSSRRVFATHHPPVEGGNGVLTVICPPLFNEFMRTQLALRELAISLAERGQHVLRFDYRGTGDSSAELDEVAISDWMEDIALTVCEGRNLSGSSIVRLLGVRAGALLACRAASACGDIERM